MKVKKMPKTFKKKFGDTEFELRKFPMQIVDWCVLKQKEIEEIDPGPERNKLMVEFQHEILKKCSYEPKIDDKYIEEESNMDDYECSLWLIQEFGKEIEKRFSHLKKKHTTLPNLKPEEQEIIGSN